MNIGPCILELYVDKVYAGMLVEDTDERSVSSDVFGFTGRDECRNDCSMAPMDSVDAGGRVNVTNLSNLQFIHIVTVDRCER